MKTIPILSPSGEVLELPVLVRVKKRAPYRRWAVINQQYEFQFQMSQSSADFKVFLCLLLGAGQKRISEIASKTGVPVRTVYRAVRRLESDGIVRVSENGTVAISETLLWNGRWSNDE